VPPYEAPSFDADYPGLTPWATYMPPLRG